MATSPYFNNFPSQNRIGSEYALMEDVIVESIQIMGHNCYYILRESVDDMDMIFGEAAKVKFKHAYLLEAYITNTEGFEGDGDFFSKFGLEIRDTSNFVISRRSFARQIPPTLRVRPQEGDLVWVPVMHRMFEIKFIEKKLMFFSLGNRQPFVYEMRCEDFRFSEEQFETGVTDIDEVEEDNAYTIRISLDTSGIGNYKDGEVVYQSPDGTWANNTASGEIKEWFKANGSMFLFNIEGSFANNANVYGNTTHAVYTTRGVIDTTTDYITNDLTDNEEFANNSILILDLSEINPFGSI